MVQQILDFKIPCVSSKESVKSGHIVKLGTVYKIKLKSVISKKIVKSHFIVKSGIVKSSPDCIMLAWTSLYVHDSHVWQD